MNATPQPTDELEHFQYLCERLTERDLQLIDYMGNHRILTTPMITQLLFPSSWTARVRISTLVDRDILTRFRSHNRDTYRYVLGYWGATIWAHREGEKPPTKRQCLTALQYVSLNRNRNHLEATNGFAARLHYYARQSTPPVEVGQWLSERQAHQACGGQLRPDAGFSLSWPDGTALRIWLEMDMGTESYKQLTAKMRRYLRHRPLDGGRSRTLLVQLPSARRENNFHNELSLLPLEFPVATCLSTTVDPLGPVWRLASTHNRVNLQEVAIASEL